ncbi:MAG: acyl-ACP--UDP-N-acetylglucosamine O-acyltransferase [Phycisphaerae bacterium]|nr:acyl-ACP--UDP-N-acetylglucosamine O-acyltransferase [Phycisphaerae bacterium]
MIQVHPTAVVDSSVQLGEDAIIGPFCVIGKGTKIGNNCRLQSHVTIGENIQIGDNNTFYPNAVIGCTPQVLGIGDRKIGGLIIGNNNIFRENVTVHTSMHENENTVIGDQNLLMIGVHVGHDCILENKIIMSNFSQVSGHVKVEEGVWLSGMVLIHQFSTIGKWCYASGMSGINHDVPPFVIISGHYPSLVRSANKRGLVRAGMNEQQQANVLKAYRKLWRNEGPLIENARKLSQEDWIDENVRYLVDSLLRSGQQRYGRYLEQFRH